ncbi:arylsulfotransferase family protein [Ruegeria arenilitoris]|uniref:arylsulfotransferase family protein n=1 Tax=Ruegeria arenilitoris TaxID=1173585 RepID=UPI00147C2DF1|nr:arylsulfotransferase family protein [Ruegeria arenilitoris]
MISVRLAVSWLIFVVGFAWGVAMLQLRIFPYSIYSEIRTFITGGLGEDSSPFDKLANDIGLSPSRWTHEFDHTATGFTYRELAVPGLNKRRDQPLIYISDAAPRGYRILFGAFDFDQTFWGAVLIGPDGKLVQTWELSTDELPTSRVPANRKNMYGVNLRPDGSIIFTMQEDGGGIISVDWCGRRKWALEGVYHHTVSPDDNGGFWTFEGNQGDFDHILTRIDSESGEVLQRVDMGEVRRQNRHIHIFDLQRQPDVWDRVHGNDIEALPMNLADKFPMFSPGDLLISYRVPNLVFVVDPDSAKIRWWRIGPWDRQHDPDWNVDGRISVYSNNERGVGDFSTIIAIDPATYETEVLLDGEDYNFFSAFNGMHQRLPAGGLIAVSAHQGRIFEADANGQVVFDFINSYDADKKSTLHVADAYLLPDGYFDFDTPPTCN